jgi:hypothetical protein
MNTAQCKRANPARINGTATRTPDLSDCEILIQFEDARHWSVPRAIVADPAGALWGVGDDLEAPERMTPREVLEWYVASEQYGLPQLPGIGRLFEIIAAELKRLGGAR